MDLTYRFEAKDPTTDIIFFTGHVNEDAEVTLAKLREEISKSCVFNMKDIQSINSCGVRAWINFLREVERDRSITFEHCPPEIVSQINMIPSFKGSAHIASVYAGYVCDNCDHQHLELFEHGNNLPKSVDEGLGDVHCPNCNSVMEMEELEEEFFSWIESA